MCIRDSLLSFWHLTCEEEPTLPIPDTCEKNAKRLDLWTHLKITKQITRQTSSAQAASCTIYFYSYSTFNSTYTFKKSRAKYTFKKSRAKKNQVWLHLSQRWIVTHFSFCHSFLDPKGHISLHSPILHLFSMKSDSRRETPSDARSEGLGLALRSGIRWGFSPGIGFHGKKM